MQIRFSVVVPVMQLPHLLTVGSPSRMGGMYLNYAEALYQYFKACGNTNAADASGAVVITDEEGEPDYRECTGYPDSSQDGEQDPPAFRYASYRNRYEQRGFREKYKNERRVELAFEGHRFYDVRRWMEDGDKFMNIHRMEITKNEDGSYIYNKVAVTRGDGQWESKWNLFPFSQTEILKSNHAIQQNPLLVIVGFYTYLHLMQ